MIRIILDDNISNIFSKLREKITDMYCFARRNLNNAIIAGGPLLLYCLPNVNEFKTLTIGFYGFYVLEKLVLPYNKKLKAVEALKFIASIGFGAIGIIGSMCDLNTIYYINEYTRYAPLVYLLIYGSLFIDSIKTLDKI